MKMHMKWWGWGAEDVEFSITKRPKFVTWAEKTLKIKLKKNEFSPVLEKCVLPNASDVQKEWTEKSKLQSLHNDPLNRVLNTYGKSYPDLIRARRGNFGNAPDVVLYPTSSEEIERAVQFAQDKKANLVPFGGGTNIVGAVEHKSKNRPKVTLNMQKYNKLIGIDPYSWVAEVEAGVLGPSLEEQLGKEGFSLGHFPDSFQFSTLGGWIATRSAGMQSDAYGKIEDMVLGLETATARGMLKTRPFPATSNGPDLNRIFSGSEGGLGIITKAKMQVHPTPKYKDYSGYLFKNFESGFSAIRELYRENIHPSMIRLQDEDETEMALALKEQTVNPSWLDELKKMYVVSKGFNKPCLMICGFEGEDIKKIKANALVAKKHLLKGGHGLYLGPTIGAAWAKHKYDVPYLRDLMIDMGVICDVSETSTNWGNLLPLYKKVKASVAEMIKERGTGGFVGCHLSHSYSTGACLYFTWAAPYKKDELVEYYELKNAITEGIVEAGGTLSHHHAVGYEHKPWMQKELGTVGVSLLHDLKRAWDPHDIFNTGKHMTYELVNTNRKNASPSEETTTNA